MHPQPRARLRSGSMRTSVHSGGTGNIRHSPRNGFTAYFALSSGTGLSCPRHRRDAFASSPTWHQRRDARTTRLRRPPRTRSSHAPLRPPHPASHVHDDRETPLLWRRDTRSKSHISEKQKLNIFARRSGRAEQLERVGEIRFKNIRAAMAWPRAHRAARRRNSPTGESQLREAGSLADDRHGEFGTGLRPTRSDETGLVSRMRCSVHRRIAEPGPSRSVRCIQGPGSAAHPQGGAPRCVWGTKAMRMALFLSSRELQPN
jgi:hypothetical protein